MKRAISYVRVSTVEQAQNGIGLDVQQHHIDAFAKLAGYSIQKRFREGGASAMGADSASKRPEFMEAVALAKKKRWPIIVASLDRASRHSETIQKLAEDGVVLIAAVLGEEPSSVVLRAEGLRGQREGELISKSTKAALQLKKTQGVKLGNRTNLPDAQKKGAASNKRVADLRTLELEPLVKEAREQGKTTAAELAEFINARGHRSPSGALWTADTIRRPLKRLKELEQKRSVDFYTDNRDWGSF